MVKDISEYTMIQVEENNRSLEFNINNLYLLGVEDEVKSNLSEYELKIYQREKNKNQVELIYNNSPICNGVDENKYKQFVEKIILSLNGFIFLSEIHNGLYTNTIFEANNQNIENVFKNSIENDNITQDMVENFEKNIVGSFEEEMWEDIMMYTGDYDEDYGGEYTFNTIYLLVLSIGIYNTLKFLDKEHNNNPKYISYKNNNYSQPTLDISDSIRANDYKYSPYNNDEKIIFKPEYEDNNTPYRLQATLRHNIPFYYLFYDDYSQYEWDLFETIIHNVDKKYSIYQLRRELRHYLETGELNLSKEIKEVINTQPDIYTNIFTYRIEQLIEDLQ